MVLSFDRYSRDDVIGEVMVELDKIDMSTSDQCPVPIAKEITPRSYKVYKTIIILGVYVLCSFEGICIYQI